MEPRGISNAKRLMPPGEGFERKKSSQRELSSYFIRRKQNEDKYAGMG